LGIPAVWLKGLEGKEKQDFETYLRNSTVLVDKLIEILSDHIEALERKQIQEEFYKDPELFARLCYLNGQLAAYNKVINLFHFRGE
jgi:hypothetical protein